MNFGYYGSGGLGITNSSGGSGSITLGEVVAIDDKDAKNPMCRVKVKYTAFANTTPMETSFVRMVAPAAGKEWGFCWIPEIGQKVLIGFVNGDTSHPYILGCLFDEGVDAPYKPEGDNKNNKRMIRSRLGSELIFDDSDEKTHKSGIVLQTGSTDGNEKGPKFQDKGRLTLKLSGKDELISLSDDKEDKNKNSIVINSKDGKCEIKAAKEITLKVGEKTKITLAGDKISIESGDIEVKAQKKVNAQGSADMALQSNQDMTIKANSKLSVSATGQTEVKGGILKLN